MDHHHRRMRQIGKVLFLGVKIRHLLSILIDSDKVTIGHDIKRNHSAAIFFTAACRSNRLHHDLHRRILLGSIGIGRIFGITEHIKYAVITDFIAGSEAGVGMVIKGTPADTSRQIFPAKAFVDHPQMS